VKGCGNIIEVAKEAVNTEVGNIEECGGLKVDMAGL
jgi:hypothetical protein